MKKRKQKVEAASREEMRFFLRVYVNRCCAIVIKKVGFDVETNLRICYRIKLFYYQFFEAFGHLFVELFVGRFVYDIYFDILHISHEFHAFFRPHNHNRC